MKIGPFGDFGEASAIHSLLIEKGFNVELMTHSTVLGTLEYNLYFFEHVDEKEVYREISQYIEVKKGDSEVNTSELEGANDAGESHKGSNSPSFVKDLAVFTILGITFFWLLNSPLEVMSLKVPTFQKGSLYVGKSLLDSKLKETTLSMVPFWSNDTLLSSLLFLLSALFFLKIGNVSIFRNERWGVGNFSLMLVLIAVLFRVDDFLLKMMTSELNFDIDQLYFSGVIAEFGLERFILGNTLFYSAFTFLSTIAIYGILIEKHSFIRASVITCTFSTIALYIVDRPATSLTYFVFLFLLLVIRKYSFSILAYLISYSAVNAAHLYFFVALS